MTFSATLSSAVLERAASRLAALVDSRISVPIMGNALLRFEAGEDGASALVLAASSIDQSLTLRVEAAGEGECTVSAARLAAAAARLQRGEKVTLAEDKGALVIRQGRTRWRVPTLPAGDYPAGVIEPVKGPSFEVEGPAFAALLHFVAAAAARADLARPYLCGVRFDFDRAALAASDGNVLARAALGPLAPPKRFKGASFTLPNDAVKPLADLARGCERLSVTVGKAAAGFAPAHGGEVLRSQFIEGDFPDWPRIVPADRQGRFRAASAALAQAIGHNALVDGDVIDIGKKKVRIHRLRFDFGQDRIAVSSRNAAGNEAESECPATRLAGTDAVLFFRGEYAAAAAASFGDAATIEFGIEDPMAPVTVVPAAGDAPAALADAPLLWVLMPMR